MFESFDHNVGVPSDRVLEDRRALRVQHAFDIEQVLDRNRHSRKQAAVADRVFHQRLGMGAGAVEAQYRQGIHFAVDLGDPLLQYVEQIERRDFAGIELIDDRTRGCAYQALIRCHLRLPFVPLFGSGWCSRVKHFPAKWKRVRGMQRDGP